MPIWRRATGGRLGIHLARPFAESPYLWIGATCVEMRRDGRIASVTVIVAPDVNREVWLAPLG